jgi:hypothetical protein
LKLATKIHLNKFLPRTYQLPILDAILNKGYKRVLAILPRRAGKDIVGFNLCIRACLQKVCTIYYIFPTYSQARKVIWQGITNTGEQIIDYIPEEIISSKNSQEMSIQFTNGSRLQLVGSDNYDSLMGTNPQGIVFSEYALQDPRAYQYLRPILTSNEGWALFLSTPRGKNHLFELYEIAKQHDSWFCYKLTVEDTNHISLHEIEKERHDGVMSEDLIQQEYYCFPSDQQVLTSMGCKGIESIVPNDMVVSHSGRLRKVLDIISREYKGDMYQISSYGSCEPIICTPDHPIRVYDRLTQKYTWKKAKEIDNEDRLVFPKMTLGDNEILREELCMLLAWYITEGSCFKNGVQWTVNKEESHIVIGYLVRLGISFDEQINGSVINIVINSVQLVDFFKSTCGLQANNKRIPFNLIGGHEDRFFHELIKGDGCHNISKGHERYCYTTVSKTLAYQVQLLANSLGLGYATGISKREAYKGKIQGRNVNCQESYQVNISFPGLRSGGKLIRARNCIAAKITDITISKFEGTVHNIKVQYDESYLIGGRAVHNCSFELGVEGSYYSKYIDKLRLRNQIGEVPWEPSFKTHTVWDLGVRDSTTIIFFQIIGQTIKIIDCYENSKHGLEHYIQVLDTKPYKNSYGKHIAPHDIRVQEFGSGITRIEKARQLGIRFTIAENIAVMDGIEAVRSTLAKVWIDERNCKPLIKALENYRQEYDAKRKIYKNHPLHDIHSHFADCMRYLAISLPKTRDGLSSPEDLDKRYRDTVLGTNSNMPSVFRDDLPPY